MVRGESSSSNPSNKIVNNNQNSAPSKQEIARASTKKAKYLCSKAFVNQLDVYRAVKDFFTQFLGRKAEFTYGELIDELHKIYISPSLRTRVYKLLRELEKVEYDDVHFQQEDLKAMLTDFQELIKMLVIEKKRELPFLTRLANWLFRKNVVEDYYSELPLIEENDANFVNFHIILEDVYLYINQNNLKKATKYYRQANSLYAQMPEEEQKKNYDLLKEAFDKIAEKNN